MTTLLEPQKSPKVYRVRDTAGEAAASKFRGVITRTRAGRLAHRRRHLTVVTRIPSLLLNGMRHHQEQHQDQIPKFRGQAIYRPVQWKSLTVSAKLPDGTWRKLNGENHFTVWELVSPVVQEFHLRHPVIRMADTEALVDDDANAALLDGHEIIVQEGFVERDARSATDRRLYLVESLLITERDYSQTLRSGRDLYEKPLRKLLPLHEDEHKLIFDWVDPICSLSSLVISKLETAVENWDPQQTRVGGTFSKQLWNQYEEFLEALDKATLPFFKDKESGGSELDGGDEFVSLCQLRQGAAKHTLGDLLHLPLERLAQYEQYLSQLAVDTAEEHPDYNDLWRAATKAKNMVKRSDSRREECDLDRIQDIFPSDNLRLYEPDPLSPRKGLLRTKSAAASKLHRALSGKTKNETRSHSPHYCNSNNGGSQNSSRKSEGCCRSYIMDSPVHFIMGVQSQERHLFLFSDLLLIAKPRSSGNYKLKEKVRVCELWLAHCIDDVCEASKSPENAFVLGWPTTNVVVTFSSLQTKELWQDKLQQLIAKAKEKEGNTVTSLQISSFDPETQEEACKTVKINNYHTAVDTIRLVLEQYGQNDEDFEDYQLWVKTNKDDAPYPLIGHEYPFCIKMNFVRQLLQRSELDLHNFNNISTDSKCCFILRKHYTKDPPPPISEVAKKVKKPRRPTIINWPFKRQPSKQDSLDGGPLSPTVGSLFGQPLHKLCDGRLLPKPVMNMLMQLFQKGPFTVGIFRKSANARACKDLKEKLDVDPDYDLTNVPIVVLASVFKEFLRSLPDCMLQSDLYYDWLHSITIGNNRERQEKIMSLLDQLHHANLELLRHTLCVLWHIAQNSKENRMTPLNLGVCIGPSILSQNILPLHPSPTMQCEASSKQVPKVIAYLIEHCTDIFGEDCLHIFGDGPERDSSHHDSGAEESDSLHSLQDGGVGHRRDDSSIDSLERVLLEDGDPSPKLPNKSKMSLTNLSRDSGLTLSDTQLYNPEDELESEASSSDSRRGVGMSHSLAKSVPHLDIMGLDNGSIISYSHGRNAGISIDGSCNDVVRKRRHIQESLRPKASNQGIPSQKTINMKHHQSTSMHHIHPSLHYTQSLECKASPRQERCISEDFTRSPVHTKLRRLQTHKHPPARASRSPVTSLGTLRRSASEESLLQKYMSAEPKRPAHHRKGRAPSPPGNGWNRQNRNINEPGTLANRNASSSSTLHPDRHAIWFASHHASSMDFKRSQSTSHIDEVDGIHDSTSISITSSDTISAQMSSCSPNDSQHIHMEVNCKAHTSQRVSSVCSSSSETSQRSQFSQNSNSSHASGNSSRSQGTGCSHNSQKYSMGKPSLPPSYQEAVNRKQMLRRLRTTSTLDQVTEQMRIEQTTLSARARQLYEESVKLYNRQVECVDDTVRALPARVDSGDEDNPNPPPLPPKPHQPLHRTASEGTPLRLRHHPPVHVSDAQILSQKWNASRKGSARVTYQYCTRRSEFPEDWKPENSWSVANLRAMFNAQQQQQGNGIDAKRNPAERHRDPPPYRPPPSHRINVDESNTGLLQKRTSHDSNNKENTISRHKRTDSAGSSHCGEESYV